MNRKVTMSPLTAIEETCEMLIESGASNEIVNTFLFESLIELQDEITILKEERLEEFDLVGGLDKISNVFGGVGKFIMGAGEATFDSVKEMATKYLLNALGIKDGLIKEMIVKFVGNLEVKEMYALIRGNLSCEVITTKSAQTLAEVVVDEYLVKPLVDTAGGASPFGTSKDAQISELIRNSLRNAFSGSSMNSPLAEMLKPHMEPLCGFYREAVSSVKSKIFGENYYRILKDYNSKILSSAPEQKSIKESFQKRMKVRLKKSMKTILDGGRKDLTKHGKPWSQSRQKYSNAFAANEANSMAAGIEGAPMTLKNREENK